MKLRLPSKKLIIGMLSILITAAILLSVVPSAYAEGTGPLTAIPGLGRPSNETLMRMHSKEGSWLRDMESLFTKSNQLSGAFQSLIDAEAKEGKNVTILTDALTTFDSEVTASREIHTLAGANILNLVGWKANGDVRDRLAAGISLLDGRAGLRDANFRLTTAIENLSKGFAKWRTARIRP